MFVVMDTVVSKQAVRVMLETRNDLNVCSFGSVWQHDFIQSPTNLTPTKHLHSFWE